MVTVHWSGILALVIGSLGCAVVTILFQQHALKCQREAQQRYAQGCYDQAQLDNRRLEAEIERLYRIHSEQFDHGYAAGWEDRDYAAGHEIVAHSPVQAA